MRNLRLCMIGSFILLTLTCLGQLTIDATGPIRQRKREAARVQGGSSGHKLPLHVTIRATGSPPDETGKTLLEFTLTNSGKNALTLPISPNPGDLEPSDPKAAYTALTLGLRVSLSKKPGSIFGGGADLYGRTAYPESLVNLAPGDSIRVLSRIALPDTGDDVTAAVVAIATLSNDSIRMVNGETLSDLQDVGFAISQEYTTDSILRSRE